MGIINNLLLDAPTGLWPAIIDWFRSFIGNYGWTIVVFTIFLKLVLSPLDVLQKASMRKTTKQQALLKPEIDKINEKYAGNKQVINQKTMELYQKNKMNPAGGCFGMLINLVLTIVIFFTLFSSMSAIADYRVKSQYFELQSTYVTTYKAKEVEYDAELMPEYANAQDYAKAMANQEVLTRFEETKEGWLWIKNIFRPDNFQSSIPTYDEIANNLYIEKVDTELNQTYYYENILTGERYIKTANDEENRTTLENAKAQGKLDYELVTNGLQGKYSSWNGYFILIILAAGATVLGQLLANAGVKAKTKKGEEIKATPQVNKIMLVVMPLIMAYFTWRYSAAFAIYIIVNSLMSALIGYVVNLILNVWDEKHSRENKPVASVVVEKEKTAKQTVSKYENVDYRIEKKGKIVYENNADKKIKEQTKEVKTNDKGEN